MEKEYSLKEEGSPPPQTPDLAFQPPPQVQEYGGGIRGPTTEEWNNYAEKIAETEGYDDVVDSMLLPEGVILAHQDFIVPMYDFGGFGLEHACENAIRKYNLKEKTKLKFKEIIKVMTDYFDYYITFTVKDPENNRFETSQARVFRSRGSYGPFKVEEVHPKPNKD